jgi:uncharacterized RDD family membrane protein YckC
MERRLLAVDPDTQLIQFVEDFILVGENLFLLLLDRRKTGFDLFELTRGSVFRKHARLRDREDPQHEQ